MKDNNEFEKSRRKNSADNDDGFSVDEYYPADDVDDEITSDYESDENDAENDILSENDPTLVFTPVKSKKKNKKLSKKQIIIFTLVFILYTAVLLAAAWIIFYRPHVDSSELPFDISEPEQSETSESEDSPRTPAKKTVYKEKGDSYNILVVGHDKLAYLADVTMIINVDTKTNSVSIMQIPRDTYVACEYITGKVNALFSSYYNSARIAKAEDPYMQALDDYATFFERNLCINIHHVAIVNLDGFRNIVDALGGVDLYVPSAMYYDDPAQNLHIDIPAGNQHLDGAAAEGFVRYRSGYVQADLGRGNAQKIFMTAFFRKLKSTIKSVDVSTLNKLINEIKDNVHTDLTLSDLMFYAKTALKIDLGNITMMTCPGSVTGMYYVINRQATLTAINSYFNIYSKDISEVIFDRNLAFCDTSSSNISAVYYDNPENILDGEYKADSIDENSINIPRTQSYSWSQNYNYVPETNNDDSEPNNNTDIDAIEETDEIIEPIETADDVLSDDEEQLPPDTYDEEIQDNDGNTEPEDNEVENYYSDEVFDIPTEPTLDGNSEEYTENTDNNTDEITENTEDYNE